MSDPVLAALIGAASGILSLIVTQFAVARAQHVRIQRASLLQRQLSEAYSPLDFWLSALATIDTPPEVQQKCWQGLQDILLRHGYLLPPKIRSDLYRLANSPNPQREAAEVYLRFLGEYQMLVDIYYRDHFLTRRSSISTILRRGRSDPLSLSESHNMSLIK